MKDFSKLEKLIGIKFKDKNLLNNAFVHRSYLNEHKNEGIESNERLEFLGDAVLELVSTEHLYKNHPDHDEGQMTNFRSALVKGMHLADISKELTLGNYLYLSHGEEKGEGNRKNYILANTLEALIGAIYLDKGFKIAEKFVKKFILTKLDEIIEKKLHLDPKCQLQELIQEKVGVTPTYEILSESGPDHAKKFEMGVYVSGELIAKGEGSSKQKAEEDAAQKALMKKYGKI